MKYVFAALAFALSTATSGFASINLFVKTSPTETTCATNLKNKGYFEASSFSFGRSSPANVNGSGGAGAGKISLQNLIIGKSFDNCSGILITQFLRDAYMPSVTIIETETAGFNSAPATILSITLRNAKITAYSLGASGGAKDMESISFGYEQACIAWTVLPTTTGAKALTTTTCYDAATNVIS